jgi:hypothetical protein
MCILSCFQPLHLAYHPVTQLLSRNLQQPHTASTFLDLTGQESCPGCVLKCIADRVPTRGMSRSSQQHAARLLAVLRKCWVPLSAQVYLSYPEHASSTSSCQSVGYQAALYHTVLCCDTTQHTSVFMYQCSTQYSNCGRRSQTSALASEPRAHEGARRPVTYLSLSGQVRVM